jgi:arsenate reductase-like glutaredoxin family protein
MDEKRITLAELIAILSKYDQSAEVCFENRDDEIDEFFEVTERKLTDKTLIIVGLK